MALSSQVMLVVYLCVMSYVMSGYSQEKSKSLTNMLSMWKKDFKQANPQLTREFANGMY